MDDDGAVGRVVVNYEIEYDVAYDTVYCPSAPTIVERGQLWRALTAGGPRGRARAIPLDAHELVAAYEWYCTDRRLNPSTTSVRGLPLEALERMGREVELCAELKDIIEDNEKRRSHHRGNRLSDRLSQVGLSWFDGGYYINNTGVTWKPRGRPPSEIDVDALEVACLERCPGCDLDDLRGIAGRRGRRTAVQTARRDMLAVASWDLIEEEATTREALADLLRCDRGTVRTLYGRGRDLRGGARTPFEIRALSPAIEKELARERSRRWEERTADSSMRAVSAAARRIGGSGEVRHGWPHHKPWEAYSKPDRGRVEELKRMGASLEVRPHPGLFRKARRVEREREARRKRRLDEVERKFAERRIDELLRVAPTPRAERTLPDKETWARTQYGRNPFPNSRTKSV
jgi:hypothetical protein